MNVSFWGAAQTVTGSKFLVEQSGIRVLMDCGLFQGAREWKNRNWLEFPVDPALIHSVVLTHAHIDHSGYLPRFRKLGFSGPIYCTPATADLLALLLPDSGKLQEEDAAYANKKQYSKHKPALPLYTEQEARETLHQLQPLEFYNTHELAPDFSFSFKRAGHILGSAMIECKFSGHTAVFSGDLGRPSQFITRKPDDIEATDWLILESTYGDRLHQQIDVRARLKSIVQRTESASGTLVIPAFAIGRTQELLFLLRLLEEAHEIPQLPVYIDSPMAIHALPIYNRSTIDASAQLQALTKVDSTPFLSHHIKAVESVEESKRLNDIKYPAIIISSSGMATGGRILHHLKRRITDPRNTVLFIGFQAHGTKGRFLVDGAKEIKIHGNVYPVRAQVEYFDALSCHADYNEILSWLATIKNSPDVFLVHGEQGASASLAQKIQDRYGWNVTAPAYGQTVHFAHRRDAEHAD